MLPRVNIDERTVEGSGLDFVALIQFLYDKLVGGDWESFLETLGTIWSIYTVFAILFSIA